MASVIKIKRTSISGNLPTTSNLSTGELALNIPDKRLYTSNSSAVLEIGSNPSTLSVNSAYSFPHTDGSAGQIMKTDGIGNLTFTDAVTSHVVTINSGNTCRVVSNCCHIWNFIVHTIHMNSKMTYWISNDCIVC